MNKYINRCVDLMFVVHDRRDSQGILWYYSFIKQHKEVLAQKKKKKKKKDEKILLVPTFSGDFYFSPYLLFLPFLVPILKNAFCFGPYRYIRNGNCTTDKWHKLRSLK